MTQTQGVTLFVGVVHPRSDTLTRAQGEGTTEGAIAAETALLCQLLGANGLSGSSNLLVAVDEVVDAQVVDIGVIGNALTREILAEIVAVGANGLSQLQKGEVVLQVELGCYTVVGQELLNLVKVDSN